MKAWGYESHQIPRRYEYLERYIMVESKTKSIYQFCVPCSYFYEIEAETEEEARQILIEKGGIEITGELFLDSEDYEKAEYMGKK